MRKKEIEAQVTTLQGTGKETALVYCYRDGGPWPFQLGRKFDKDQMRVVPTDDRAFFVISGEKIVTSFHREGQQAPDGAFSSVLDMHLQVRGSNLANSIPELNDVDVICFRVCDLPQRGKVALVDAVGDNIGLVIQPETAKAVSEEAGLGRWYEAKFGESFPPIAGSSGHVGEFLLPA